MTDKNLYTVILRQEVVVFASSSEEAAKITQNAIENGAVSMYSEDFDILPGPMEDFPVGWDADCFPFCASGVFNQSIREWIDAGAAPKFKASK